MVEVNNHKLQYHPERVAQWRMKGECFPIYIEIGPTNLCNHDCVFCALDWVTRGTKFIDKKVMLDCLRDMAKHGVKSVMFAGEGEPLLHKNIELFVKKAKENGMDVSITTNGVLLSQERIKEILPFLAWIRFSLDAATAKTHSQIHKTNKTDFNKILENIRNTVNFKKKSKLKVVIGVQFLLIPQNIKETVSFAKLMKHLEVDNVQIKPYSQHPNSINKFNIKYKDYAYLEDKLKKLNSNNFKVFFRKETMKRLKEVTYDQCYGLPFFALIDSKGNVIPCNLFYDNIEFTYGNINNNSFSEIWNSQKRKKVRQKIIAKGCEECREVCRLDVINRYLHRIKFPEEHDNFP